jgi:hypothetical protein
MSIRWKKIDLPFRCSIDWTKAPAYPEIPDLSEREKEKFGFSAAEKQRELFGKSEWVSHPSFDKMEKVRFQIQQDLHEEGELEDFSKKFETETNRRLRLSKDADVKKQLEWIDFERQYRDWQGKQPEIIAWHQEADALHQDWAAKQNQKSFYGRGLAKAGTLIEVKEGKKTKQYLIGNINELGGICDDCCIPDNAKVKRYKVIWSSDAS